MIQLPGNAQHLAFLQTIIKCYQDDLFFQTRAGELVHLWLGMALPGYNFADPPQASRQTVVIMDYDVDHRGKEKLTNKYWLLLNEISLRQRGSLKMKL